MVALIILGGAYSVVTLRAAAGHSGDKARANLEKVVKDSLTVLDGLGEGNTTLLDAAMTEQLHCARDAAPSASSCLGGRSVNLSQKLQSYLPAGAVYSVALSNGVRASTLYAAPASPGESVSSELAYVPSWNTTFALTELSCYDPSMAVNATLVPLAHARVENATSVTASLGALHVAAVPAGAVWNASFPAATRPAAGTLVASATARATGPFPGATAFASCALGATGSAVVGALRQDALVLPTVARVGAPATLAADLHHLAASGATLLSSNLTLYEPVPGRPGEADTWIPAAVIPLGSSTTPSATWTPPGDALFGAHPVALRATMQAGGVVFEARLVGVLPVALPSGVVPIDPPYRAMLQAWFPDWH